MWRKIQHGEHYTLLLKNSRKKNCIPILTLLSFFKGKNKDDKDSDSEMDEQDFIDKPKGLLKKNYIYVTQDDRVVIKNLGIKKKSMYKVIYNGKFLI